MKPRSFGVFVFGVLVFLLALSAPAMAHVGYLKVCKEAQGTGVTGSFSFTLSSPLPEVGTTTPVSTFTLTVGQCRTFYSKTEADPEVTVSETARTGFQLCGLTVEPVGNQIFPPDLGSQSVRIRIVTSGDGSDPPSAANTTKVTFCNETIPIVTGRFTGGGSFACDGLTLRHGFELHCSPTIVPNRLEINYGVGNNFHLLTLTEAVCSDTDGIDEGQPDAGFDTITGSGAGLFNGLPALIEFAFTDAGEPGADDTAAVKITTLGTGVVVECLEDPGTLQSGNQQAHPQN